MGRKKYSCNRRSRRRSKMIDTTGAIETLRSGETALDVPQDIVTEILVRLPAKTLLRFKCVAKSWLALISSPDFVKAHSTCSTLDPTLSNYRFLLRVSYSPDKAKLGSVTSLPLRDVLNDAVGVRVRRPRSRDTNHQIEGSCNGLLCVSTRHHGTEYVFLWNPCLRMSKKLPPMHSAESTGILMSRYGVAYDERNDDYKVVGILSLSKFGAWGRKVEIYSLKNDSWKAIEGYKGGNIAFSSPVPYANGKIHFLRCFRHRSVWDIVSLDVEDEVYGTVELPDVEQPEYDFDYYPHVYIGASKDCITVLYSYAGEHVDVWVLKEYGVRESWTKAVRIPYGDGSLRYRLRLHNLCISSNGKFCWVMDPIWLFTIPKITALYALR